MVTKLTEDVHVPQKEVVIEAAGTRISEETKRKAQIFVDKMTAQVEQQTEDFATRMAARIESADPTLLSGYQYWNVLTIGPIQFFGNPPYQPSNVVAAGEDCLMLGLIWINPVNSPGGGLPGTLVLGGRDYNLRFESINLSTVQDGPDGVFSGTFPSPAPVVTPILWWVPTPDPGAQPALYEVHMTVDTPLPGQPFAAFSTWHFDMSQEPSFLGTPATTPELVNNRPARFMIYRR
jgi:hypothetical protein